MNLLKLLLTLTSLKFDKMIITKKDIDMEILIQYLQYKYPKSEYTLDNTQIAYEMDNHFIIRHNGKEWAITLDYYWNAVGYVKSLERRENIDKILE